MDQEHSHSLTTNFHVGGVTGSGVVLSSLNPCREVTVTLDAPIVVQDPKDRAPPWDIDKLRRLVSLGHDGPGANMPLQVVINLAVNAICDILQNQNTKTCLFCGTEKGVCSNDNGQSSDDGEV